MFDEEIERLLSNTALLADRGWMVLDRVFPLLTIVMHHRRTGKIRTFKFDCSNWNDDPPALSIIDPETRAPLPGAMWPRYQSYWHQSGWLSAAGISTSKPFMCMAGIREYHTHQSHICDLWEKYRSNSDFQLLGIVSQVAQVFQKSDV